MPYINETTRLMLWRQYHVAYDAHLNIVARVNQDGYIDNCYEACPLMFKIKTPEIHELGRLWKLDYPVANDLLGLFCNDTYNALGYSVCVAKGSPLGRAIVKLQRRFRFRMKARQTLHRILSQITRRGRSLDEVSVDAICSCLMVVSIYPRVV